MLDEKMKACADCGALLEEEEYYYNNDGEPICEYCMDDYYTCDDCGEIIPVDDVYQVNNNETYVCEGCLRDYYRCDDCGDLYDHWMIHTDNYGTVICNNCFDGQYNRCVDCECIIHEDITYYMIGNTYCESCYYNNDYRCGYIHSYNYRPHSFTMYGSSDDGSTALFYGVELEIDGGGNFNICGELGEIEEIYLKEDGSLSSGFEIVTHPAALDYHLHELPWADICSIARSGGYKSHDTSTCGLHIHASRTGFGRDTMEQDLTIAKLMLLFDRFWDTHIVPFSRRDYNTIHRWAKKPNSTITDKDTAGDAVQKVQNHKYDRYQAINLTNRHTVEIRIFRGTLKASTIKASIQWIDTLIHFCKKTPLKDFARVKWEEIFANTEHVELKEYMEKRNLLKMGGM